MELAMDNASPLAPTWARISSTLALTGGLLGIGHVVFEGWEVSNPPDYSKSWLVFWVTPFIVVALALAGAWRTRDALCRYFSTAGIFSAFLSAYGSASSYFANWDDLPRLVVLGLPGLIVIGGWMAGLRVAPIAIGLFAGWWLVPPFIPPDRRATRVARADGLECEVNETGVTLRDPTGRALSASANLMCVTTESKVGPLFPGSRGWAPARDDSTLEGLWLGPRGSVGRLGGHGGGLPDWGASYDFQVLVPRWPSRAAASVEFPLTHGPQPDIRSPEGNARLAVSRLRWGDPPWQDSTYRNLKLTLEYSLRGGRSGFRLTWFRAVDDLGQVVPMNFNAVGSGSGSCEIWPIDPKAKRLRIDFFDPADVERSVTVFTLHRLPIRRR